jgi:uncharacterized protein (DUF1697 family)
MTRYVALLRGINVGGKNLIGMSALRAQFEGLGLRSVSTYIQSGNVLFSSNEPRAALVKKLEKSLSREFSYTASLMLRSQVQMKRIVEFAPEHFGTKPARYRYDVLFLKEPLTAKRALESVSTKEGVDEVVAGAGVLYFSRLIAKATQSHLPRLVAKPVYQQMTIRNWHTTTKLLALLSE